jgi:N-acetylmuramoyl-L-alanine amidase-like protein
VSPLVPPGASLPYLRQRSSPNQSDRAAGVVPYLVIVHRPVGAYIPSIAHLCNPAPGGEPRRAVSAHLITDSSREATQLVPWHRKAWAARDFNSCGYQLEIDDDAWTGADPPAFYTAARIVAFLCKRTGIPPVWSTSPLSKPGVVRHADLGLAGGNHSDPTTDIAVWRRFIERVRAEHDRGGFRPTYGVGELLRIDT